MDQKISRKEKGWISGKVEDGISISKQARQKEDGKESYLRAAQMNGAQEIFAHTWN